MTKASPHRIRPIQPEFIFGDQEQRPERPAAQTPPAREYDEAPPVEALQPPPPLEYDVQENVMREFEVQELEVQARAEQDAAQLPHRDYDETPPDEVLQAPPPAEGTPSPDAEISLANWSSRGRGLPQTKLVVTPNRSFGKMLQELRSQHQLTIRELAEKVRITESAIQALESGDIRRLKENYPNLFYCRSQIERICNAYGDGSSPEPILEAFNAEEQKLPTNSSDEPLVQEEASQDETPWRISTILLSALIALLLLLILGGWAYKRYEIGRQEKSSADYDLPALLPPPHLPLTPLEIPTH